MSSNQNINNLIHNTPNAFIYTSGPIYTVIPHTINNTINHTINHYVNMIQPIGLTEGASIALAPTVVLPTPAPTWTPPNTWGPTAWGPTGLPPLMYINGSSGSSGITNYVQYNQRLSFRNNILHINFYNINKKNFVYRIYEFHYSDRNYTAILKIGDNNIPYKNTKFEKIIELIKFIINHENCVDTVNVCKKIINHDSFIRENYNRNLIVIEI
jgi:hypothetical protein